MFSHYMHLINYFVSVQSHVNDAANCDQVKAEENAEADAEQVETDTKLYKVVFPDTSLDLLYMAFNVLESSVERVSDAREKMATLSVSEPDSDNKVCLINPKNYCQHISILNSLCTVISQVGYFHMKQFSKCHH